MGIAVFRKSTNRPIEWQSSPRPGACLANAVANGHPANDLEERTMDLQTFNAAAAAFLPPPPLPETTPTISEDLERVVRSLLPSKIAADAALIQAKKDRGKPF